MKSFVSVAIAFLSMTANAGTGDVGTARYQLVSNVQRSGANVCPNSLTSHLK